MRSVFLVLMFVPLAAAAETAYVTDNLRLGLHRAEDTSDRAFRTLESGQELEIISRTRNYANVRLPDGTQGHVKAAYLVVEKPAKLIVNETQSALESVRRELERTKAAFAAPAETISKLEGEIAQKDAALNDSTATITELREQNEDYQDRYGQYKYSLPFKWVGGAMLVCLLGGFLFGLWWVDHRSRKRHGGIRVY